MDSGPPPVRWPGRPGRSPASRLPWGSGLGRAVVLAAPLSVCACVCLRVRRRPRARPAGLPSPVAGPRPCPRRVDVVLPDLPVHSCGGHGARCRLDWWTRPARGCLPSPRSWGSSRGACAVAAREGAVQPRRERTSVRPFGKLQRPGVVLTPCKAPACARAALKRHSPAPR